MSPRETPDGYLNGAAHTVFKPFGQAESFLGEDGPVCGTQEGLFFFFCLQEHDSQIVFCVHKDRLPGCFYLDVTPQIS